MRYGFIKVAAATPDIRVADCEYNRREIACRMKTAAKEGAKLLVLPELCITGYTLRRLVFAAAAAARGTGRVKRTLQGK